MLHAKWGVWLPCFGIFFGKINFNNLLTKSLKYAIFRHFYAIFGVFRLKFVNKMLTKC